MKIFSIIKKNFKILLRSKLSALVIVLGPLLIITLSGLAFNNLSTYTINVGVYSNNYNQLTNSFMDALKAKNFKVTKYETKDLCVDQIKRGQLHACIIFPEDFRIANDKINEITFYVDYSKVNIVYMILDSVSSSISSKRNELSVELTNQLLDTIEYTKARVDDRLNTTTVVIEDSAIIKTKANSMNLETGDLTTSVISSSSSTLNNRFKTIKESSQKAIKEGISIINDMEDEAGLSNSSINGLNESKGELLSINNSLTTLFNSTNLLLSNLSGNINSLDSAISELKNNLANAKTAKSDILKKIDLVQTNVGLVKTSLTEINDKIKQLSVTQAETIVSPITTKIEPVIPEKTPLNYLFPSLVVLLIMLISILLASSLVVMEKISRAYFRNFTTPTPNIYFVAANFITTLSLVLAQLIVVVGVASYFFKVPLFISIWETLLVVVLLTSLFTLLGLIIGHFFNTQETASVAAISLAALFLLGSNLILPLESMPDAIRDVANHNPFVLGSEVLKKTILFNTPFESIKADLIMLLIYSGAVLLLLLLSQRLTRFRIFPRLTAPLKKAPEPSEKDKEKK
jgi:ABC-type multidrug transport system permease subunit